MYSAKFNVWFYETDMMGIAHHSNHFRWFENARVEYLRHIGITLGSMMDEDMELISIYYGEDAAEEEAEQLRDAAAALYPSIDVELQAGGQPVYYYIVSAE